MMTIEQPVIRPKDENYLGSAIPQDAGLPGTNPIDGKPRRPSKRDQQKDAELHNKLYGFFTDEMDRQALSRYQMAIDEDYADGLQWDEEEIQALANRNQSAPTYNCIKPSLLWIRGTEMRTRTDFKILARKKDEQARVDAEMKTGVMKYLADVNRHRWSVSQAFDEAITSGISFLEDGAVNNPDEVPVYSGWESWKNILFDSCGKDQMQKDWRYMFRFRDLDLDIACAMFPQKWQQEHLANIGENDRNRAKEEFYHLGTSSNSADWPSVKNMGLGRRQYIDNSAVYSTTRKRVRVIEAWYRKPESKFICRGAMFDGEEFDHTNEDMSDAYDTGAIMVVNATKMTMRVAFMTDTKILDDQLSPYNHNDFPFTPIWCYRRKRDGAPYGIVREMRDPQDSMNKHMSKAQWLLASNQIIADHDATDNWKRLRAAADKPNGTIIVKKGSQIKIERHQGEAAKHVELATLDMRMIRENYGTNTDNLGLQSNAQSGRAILARQEQGSVTIQPVFDNLILARQVAGSKRLSLAEQYMTEQRVVRVLGKTRGQWDYHELNKPKTLSDGSVAIENDMSAFHADFVMDEQDWRASIRQAMAETMADMISKMPPEVGFKFLDMWVELLDIPNREDYVRRVRQLNGMTGDSQDPQDQAINQVKKEAEAAVQKFQEEVKGEMQALQKSNESLKQQNMQLQAQVLKAGVKLENKSQEQDIAREEVDVRRLGVMKQFEAAMAGLGVKAGVEKAKLDTADTHHTEKLSHATQTEREKAALARDMQRDELSARDNEQKEQRQHETDSEMREQAANLESHAVQTASSAAVESATAKQASIEETMKRESEAVMAGMTAMAKEVQRLARIVANQNEQIKGLKAKPKGK